MIRHRKQINRAVKQRLCIDFDGVIYNNKYKDNRIDLDNPPIDGSIDFCKRVGGRFKLLVNSARCEDAEQRERIAEYLKHWGISAIVTEHKPTAHYYIDDRAVVFSGDWDSVSKIIKI